MNKSGMSKQTSKTTLNIMNVTFNSRPGVKNYIDGVIGPRRDSGHTSPNQLGKAALRQNKHNGYNNFYFIGKNRGTAQKWNDFNQ